MIDFRYHLVSLISVFLALAVGIALGAGPLKDTVSDTLTGQVDQLRAEKEDLRTQLDEASADLSRSTQFAGAAGTELVTGSLPSYRVAVVLLGEVPAADREAIDARLVEAGATVTVHATLAAAWTDPEQRSYRQSLVGFLTDYLDPLPPTGAGVSAELAQALVQGLIGADPAQPDVLTENAAALLDLLSTGDQPMVTLDQEVTVPADAVVVLAVPVEEPAADATAQPTPDTDAIDAQLAVLTAAQQLSHGAVLVDGQPLAGSLTRAVLTDSDLAATMTTVSGMDTVFGQVAVPLALAARIDGTNGHYGFGDGLTMVPGQVDLLPVDRTPVTATPAGGPVDPATASTEVPTTPVVGSGG